MVKARKKTVEVLVPHPKYGAGSFASGAQISEELIRAGSWRLRDAKIFPGSALLADISKQNYALYPRRYYVDIVNSCRDCKRNFIFFAREQRYWFETLRFQVEAECVRCSECRRAAHVIQRRLARYSALAALSTPSRKQLMVTVDDAIFLLAEGVLRDLDKIGRLKNMALKTAPEFEGTALLANALAAARSRTGQVTL